MTTFSEQLHRKSLRVTEARLAVFKVLSDATEPLSLMEIARLTQAIDRSSVYRTIDVFVSIGIAKVVPYGWKKKFELADAFGPHHHHMRCTRCQSVHHVADSEIEHAVTSVAKRHGFLVSSHQFELEGLCKQCQTAGS